MAYSYIRLVQSYDDPVWGQQAVTWCRSPLIRVWRNRIKKSVFEWVGCPGSKVSVESYREAYPIVMMASETYPFRFGKIKD